MIRRLANIKSCKQEVHNEKLAKLGISTSPVDEKHVYKRTTDKATFYRKTFPGVYLNWNSLTSRRYKASMIKCLAERIWHICAVKEDKQLELERLKIILQCNEYPLKVTEETLQRFLERKAQPHEPVCSPEKLKRYVKLLYVG